MFISELSDFTGGCAFTFDDPKQGPFIALPSRTNEPTRDGFIQRALAEAVHETTHVFNFTSRPNQNRCFSDPCARFSDPWTWFDEATAVTTERIVLPSNVDSLRYGMHWTDEPETSLDSDGFWYESFPFVSHLHRRFRDEKFLGRIWEEAREDERWPLVRPFDILSRLVGGNGVPYDSRDVELEKRLLDFFASAYFSWDQNSWCFAPDLYARYGERNLTESFMLRDKGRLAYSESAVNHLAARYFRLFPRTQFQTLNVTVKSLQGTKSAPLQASVTPVSEKPWRPFIAKPLASASQHSNQLVLTGQISPDHLEEIDHFIVVVANCGLRADSDDPKQAHDDNQPFRLEMTLS